MQSLKILLVSLYLITLLIAGCSDEKNPVSPPVTGVDPSTAPKAVIDRFSTDAGNLFVRDGNNELPAANAPINFDQTPFITQGLGPDGEIIKYYNFDVMPLESAPIFVLFREGESDPVPNQLNIVNVIPGDAGYNDFWNVNKVTVPADYVANVITSYDEIVSGGYAIEKTNQLVNCPVVPEGSTASLRLNSSDTGLTMGWYKGKVIFYFNFVEAPLTSPVPPQGYPGVPLAGILVSFNINPGEPGGGPPSGFKTEQGNMQTHNVVASLPGQPGYSPFWDVSIYDNSDFDMVMDWMTATQANLLVSSAAMVNCPVVSVN